MMHLFVYGTLGPNKPNSHILECVGGEWSKGYVNGTLKESGWGAKRGFPGLILDKNGDRIAGYIFSSENLSGYWDKLDAFEGIEYKRVNVEVIKEDGTMQFADVYVLNDKRLF